MFPSRGCYIHKVWRFIADWLCWEFRRSVFSSVLKWKLLLFTVR
jgi:hypothetical protein